MYAFPDGLPYFSKNLKIHLMGHSMGGLTARHFQYMLDSGEFSRFGDLVPKSNFIKSMTFFAGAINGSLAPSNHGGNWCKNERKTKFNNFGKWIFGLKMCIWAQNFFVSQNEPNEWIKSINPKNDIFVENLLNLHPNIEIFELDFQWSNFFYE